MGKTQRAVSELFSQSIAESAAAGPTIVLLDEVETLAADRSKMSLEANPIDIHRATDAVLVQLDALAERIRTCFSRHQQFSPGCGRGLHVAMRPCRAGAPAGPRSMRAHPERLPRPVSAGPIRPSRGWPASSGFDRCAAEYVGLDGRAIRKTVANALASTPQTAMNPERVTAEDLLAAARAAKAGRLSGGKAP